MSAETSAHRLRASVDALLAELAAADRTGKAVERWCDAMAELHEATLRAVRKRQFGTASITAPFETGLPSPHKPAAAGFVVSLK